MKVFGYIRVSTIDQADSGLGLQAQRDAINREFEARWKPQGYEWGGIYEDAAVSGKRAFLSRPAGLRLSTEGNVGDVFLFSKLDRAFRSVIDSLQTIEVWRQRKVRCVFLDFNLDTETSVGEFVLTVMSAFAQMERRRISERTKEGQAVARARGKWLHDWRWMTLKFVRDPATGKKVGFVRPDIFALGQKVIEWRNKGVSWMSIYRTLKNNGVQRPKTTIVSKFKENDWWGATSLQNLHRATIYTQLWLSQGKVKWPKGWQAPDAPEVKDTSDASKP